MIKQTIKRTSVATLFAILISAIQSVGDVQESICVRHLESPIYDRLARQTWTQGDVKLKIVIGTNGNIVSVERVSGVPLLAEKSEQNIRKWSFNSGPERTLEITYEYKLEEPKLYSDPPTKVSFDLPHHVKLVSNFGEPQP